MKNKTLLIVLGLMLISQMTFAMTREHTAVKSDSVSQLAEHKKAINGVLNKNTTINLPQGASDLQIPAIDATPIPVRLDQNFSITPTFSNVGGAAATNVQIDYYFSFDSVISNSDIYLGSNFVNLAAGSSVSQTININPLSSVLALNPGTYYLGMIIPSENEYWFRSGTITVLPAAVADLQLTALSATPAIVSLNQSLSLSATLINAGNVAASAAEIRYYLSLDTVISNTDFYLGNDFVNVAALASTTETITINPLSSITGLSTGTYYLGITIPSENEYWYGLSPITVQAPATPAEISITPLSLEFSTTTTQQNEEEYEKQRQAHIQTQLERKEQLMEPLLQKALNQGSIRVIVGMRLIEDFKSVGLITSKELNRQNANIKQSQNELMQFLSTTNAKLLSDYNYIPYSVYQADYDALKLLEQSSDVISVEEDKKKSAFMASSNAVIGSANAWNQGFTGSNQTVAVLDTGVDNTHPFFTTGSNKIVSEACYSTNSSASNSVCAGGASSSTTTNSGVPCTFSSNCSHGTHVAGTVAGNDATGPDFGVAKGANIIAIQVFSQFNSQNDCGQQSVPCPLTFTSDQIKGLERVFALRNSFSIAAVNMSLGGGQYFDNASCDAANTSIKAAIDNLRSVGIATVIASGNSGYTTSMGSPACISSAISVGASTDNDDVASFSNIASFIDLIAPGVNITSSIPGGGVEVKDGTSMASPHVAGAWAVLKQANPTATIDDVLAALTSSATSFDDNRFGGSVSNLKRINVDLALNEFGSSQLITITNEGGSDLVINDLSLDSPAAWISWSSSTPIIIPAASSKNLSIIVDFNLAPDGLSSRRLLVSSNDSNESPYPGGVTLNVNKSAQTDMIFLSGFE